MKNAASVIINGKFIGKVYFSSHGVWVAEPNFSIYSKSFLGQTEAIDALIQKFIEK